MTNINIIKMKAKGLGQNRKHRKVWEKQEEQGYVHSIAHNGLEEEISLRSSSQGPIITIDIYVNPFCSCC